MRRSLVAASAALAFLTACGGARTEERTATNEASRETAKEGATNAMTMLAAAPAKDQALKIIHDRHEAMEGLGKAMKTLHRELESGAPDINAVRAQTSIMASTAARIPGFFPAGTGPDIGKTRAKPEIWRQQDLFIRKSKEFLAAAQTIDAAAKAGNLNKVMASHDSLDRACKSCHDPFRAPEH